MSFGIILPHRWTRQPQGPVELDSQFVSGLLGFFPLGPAWPIGANLLSGQNSLTFAGSPDFVPADFGVGLRFDAETEYASGYDATFSQEQTLCVTFKPLVVDANVRTILIKRHTSGLTSGENEFQLTYSSSQIQFAIWDSGNSVVLSINSSYAPVAGKTYHIVITEPASGGTGYMYINGSLAGSATKTASRINSTTIFQIGAYSGGNNARFLNGVVANVGWWARQWPQGLAKQASENLYTLYRPIQRRIYVPSAGGVAAALEVSAAAAASATGALTTAIPLAGAALVVGTATGALSTQIPLAGSAAAVTIASGTLTAQIRLSGAALAQALASAGLTTGISLAGAAGAAASASGTLAGGGADLAGTAQAVATAAASLTAQITLSGAAIAAALAQAELTTTPAGLAGSAQASAQAAGNLTTAIPLSAAAVAQALASGTLDVQIPLSAAAVASALASASLYTEIRLAGAATAAGTATAALTGGTPAVLPQIDDWTVRGQGRSWRVAGQGRDWTVRRSLH